VDGAALGVDVVAPALPGEELERWRLARHGVLAAVAEAGGSLAAVGTHHAGWHRRVRGAAAEGAARALRAWLDPRAIMNPGKLLAPD
jgi:FAD/FMN-containing dehydrogenase